nr:uncharacterized protein LOC112292468 isoform X2 [Physcomitrium patens]|eukprot:XP_024396762.1 uncharacterized protein LOC112292468 isoform X2 [Physcomitrella patens]
MHCEHFVCVQAMDESTHRTGLQEVVVGHGEVESSSERNDVKPQARGSQKRKALREVIYLKNELKGWKTSKLQLDKRLSTLSIALVLVISMLYNGAFSPPGAFVVTTIEVSNTIRISKNDGMLGTADNDEVSISYQDAIRNNITRTLSSFPMKYFLRPEKRSHKLKPCTPVNHKVLFDEVLEFHKRCLPGELEICTYLQRAVTWFLLIALVATLGAYPSALLAPDFSTTWLGPPILLLSLVFVGIMIPLVILWRMLDFDDFAQRYHDRSVGPIILNH